MWRFLSGVASALLLVAAGFFVWQGQAEKEQLVPPAPPPAQAEFVAPPLLQKAQRPAEPPSAPAKSKEEKRFARADKDDDGRITPPSFSSRARRPSPSSTRTATAPSRSRNGR